LLGKNGIVDITSYVGPLVDREGESKGDPLVAAIPALRRLGPELTQGLARWDAVDAAFLSPVAHPSKILAAPNNYKAHLEEMRKTAFSTGANSGTMEESGFFLKATTSLVGPSEGIAQRFLDRRTDHEVELVVVIGTMVDWPVTKEEALNFVAGYSVGLDITLRGKEERSLRKSIDTYTVLGPFLVTADEVPNVSALKMQLSVNGAVRQSTLLSDMLFGAAEQVAFASKYYALYPGDLIYTGTPSGVGPIRPGDAIDADIESIGRMHVRVRAFEPAAPPQRK
jgi:2-keto-4-pentenoate hydratase/2-oxohepta-3-ene-1,7-dioic acid hydratase in catechol pathway